MKSLTQSRRETEASTRPLTVLTTITKLRMNFQIGVDGKTLTGTTEAVILDSKGNVINTFAARLASSIKPRSSTVTIAAGLVSTRTCNRSCASILSRRLRSSSPTNNPHPASASVSKPIRVAEGSSELKSALSTAQLRPSNATTHRGRKPAASMIGNK
jgi:hypothetical protein